jgi:hypothetical protein
LNCGVILHRFISALFSSMLSWVLPPNPSHLSLAHPEPQLPMQIAVLKETEAKGPYCSLVIAVVVAKDVLVFVAFSLNIELARTVGGWAACMSWWVRVRARARGGGGGGAAQGSSP